MESLNESRHGIDLLKIEMLQIIVLPRKPIVNSVVKETNSELLTANS